MILYKIRIQTAIILHSLWCIIFSYVNKEIVIQVFVMEKKQILNISQNINPKLPIKTGIWKNTERMNEIQ